MAYDPQLGYDPAQNAPHSGGPQTQEQWVADVASSMALEFLNADGSRATSGMMNAALWAKAGIPLPPQEYIGILAQNPNAAVPPIVYNSMVAMAKWLAANPQEAAAVGLIAAPPPGGAVLSPEDQDKKFEATQAEKDREATQAENAKDREATAVENQKGRDFTGAENQKQREFDAAQAALDRAESARQFDLNIAEDRRQFNATFLSDLLNTAVNLAKEPVDWLGYQYFMQNINIPLSAVNFASVANLLGAIPPTGPSDMGPVTGGPAVVDGDMALYQASGATAPVFAPVDMAVQANPGTMPGLSAQDMYKSWQQMGLDLEMMVSEARQNVAQIIPSAAQLIEASKAASPLANPLEAGPFGGASPTVFTPRPAPPVLGPQAGGLTPAPQPDVMAAHAAMQQRYPSQATAPTPPGLQASSTGVVAPAGAASVSKDMSTGVYTGATATPAAGTVGTGAQNPQGDAMLQAIAAETGIPLQQLQQLVPVHLLAGGYSKDAIINSPAVKAVRDGIQAAAFRTEPVGDSKFGTIQAFGIPLGLRGGQDFQLDQFLKSNPDMQQQQIGVVKATGQSVNDFFKQAQRTAPIGPYGAGAFGKQRF